MINTTEILTNNGWTKIGNLTLDDTIATYNLHTDALEWHKPRNINILLNSPNLHNKKNNQNDQLTEYPEELHEMVINIVSEDVDIICSTSHTILVKDERLYKKDITKFKLCKVGDLKHTSILKKDVFNLSKKKPIEEIDFKINFTSISSMEYMLTSNKKKEMNMDSWLEFLGIYLAHGCLCEVAPFIRFKFPNQKILNNLLKFQPLLDIYIEYSEKEDYHFIYSYSLYDYLGRFRSKRNRVLPTYLLNLSHEQSQILIYFILCSRPGLLKPSVFETQSSIFADQLQILAIKSGLAADIKYEKRYTAVTGDAQNSPKPPKPYNNYTVTIYNNMTKLEPTIEAKNYRLIKPTEHIEYTYDIDVENSTFLIRRNKKYCWVGSVSKA